MFILGGYIVDNNFFLILLFLGMKNNSSNSGSKVDSISSFISTMELDNKYTLEKITMVREVGPYFPENYIPLLNKSINFAEKFIKLNEVLDFMGKDNENYILEHIPMKDNKGRLNKIISTIEKNSPKSIENSKIFDLILNMDKYEKMFKMLNMVMSNENNLNDPAKLINLMGPLMGGKTEDGNDNLKEMTKMMDIIKLLDTSKKKPI